MAARAPGAGQQATLMGSSTFEQQQPGESRCCRPHSVLIYQMPKTPALNAWHVLHLSMLQTSHPLQASAVGGCWVLASARCRATTMTAACQAGRLQPAGPWQVHGQVVKILACQNSQASSRG